MADAPIRVAVIDSGVEADHPALEGCVDPARSAAVDRHGVVTVGAHDDPVGHGTACAGIIHALAPHAAIGSIRVATGPRSSGTALIAALRWADEQRFDLINVSVGSTSRRWALPLQEVCDHAAGHDALVIAADHNDARPSYPALCTNVLRISHGDLLAPSLEVDALWRLGGRRRVSGNSYAAAYVSGRAAQLWAQDRALRPTELAAALHAAAVAAAQRAKRATRPTAIPG